jgi:predicted PurR-regulated permease PerM
LPGEPFVEPLRQLSEAADLAIQSERRSGTTSMNPFDKRTARVLLTILGFAAVLAFLYLARKPLIIFLFAMLFAYLLEPIIGKVQQWAHRSRGFAIAVIYLALLIGLVTGGLAAGPRIVDEARKLSQAMPELYEKVTSGNIAVQLGRQRGWSYETQLRIRDFIASHREYVNSTASSIGSHAGDIVTNLGWIVLIPILAVFFLKDKSRFSQSAQRLIDDRQERSLFRAITSDLDQMLAHFVRAQVFVAVISWVAYTIALTVMGVQYSFVLGAIGGVLEFIPVVGPLVAAILMVGVGFLTNYSHLFLVVVFLGVWRVMQDYIISPRILGERVELHPLAAIFGVLAGAEIGGVIGVYLAIPAMAAARILWVHWQTYKEAARTSPQNPEAVIRPGERAA